MSGNSDSGIGEAGGAVVGVAVGAVMAGVIYTRRQRRLAREAARFFDPGEQLAAPIGYCSRGGRRLLLAGLGTFLLAIPVGLVCSVTHNDALTGAVFFGGMGVGLLIMVASVPLAKNYAIVLTDRRLLLFRTKGLFKQRLRKIEIGVPRSQASMNIRGRVDGAAVNFSFAPATGIPPVSLDAYQNAAAVTYARAIQEALTTEPAGG
jgi:hypothetical protein